MTLRCQNFRASIFIYICGLLITAHFISKCCADVSLSTKDQDSCPSTDPDCNLAPKSPPDYKLYQIEGGKTGFVQDVQLQGTHYKVITRSMKPLLFEIPKFLSDEECDRIVELAKQEGLGESGVLDGGYDDFIRPNDTSKDKPTGDSDDSDVDDANKEQCDEMIKEFDMDNNGQLSAKELVPFFEKASTSALREEDIKAMMQELKFDSNTNGELSLQECYKANTSALEAHIDKIENSNPLYRTRYSEQAWLNANNDSDPVLLKLQQRILELTKLPQEMIEGSEPLQVVKYTVNGHFHAHYDSTLKRKSPCCGSGTHDEGSTCNLCRFMTILYYLNNVPEGGETAFPVADNDTYNEEEFNKKGLDNLSVRCHESNVVVKPVKGTAVLWYNHHIDPTTGGMGMMDKYGLHGGCDVRKGVKWIANNWINSPYMHL